MTNKIHQDKNGGQPPAGDGLPDGPSSPGRPVGAPKRVPGQDIDKKNAERDRDSKDSNVKEDGRGHLTRDK